MKVAIQRLNLLDRVVLLGCIIMFLYNAITSVFGDREGAFWVFNLVVAILMLIVLTATFIAPATSVSWDETRLAITRRTKLVLEGDWTTLRVKRQTRRKFQIEDAEGRDARLFVERIPEELVILLEKKSAEQGVDPIA